METLLKDKILKGVHLQHQLAFVAEALRSDTAGYIL